ncbi:hypothetical protein [Caballeronia sp. BR00000012568055]|uniref:hypothetical protein n=1 Tax=Caballeronia sp. BR00000012568055 TaxID=2918761 RepID=UPI0023F61FE6|nr:hypothetical protein [Caballeronia sp. BR00000012568055]
MKRNANAVVRLNVAQLRAAKAEGYKEGLTVGRACAVDDAEARGFTRGLSASRFASRIMLERFERERDAATADARRYRAFFDVGLPVCFGGVEFTRKTDADQAIDTAIRALEHDRR